MLDPVPIGKPLITGAVGDDQLGVGQLQAVDQFQGELNPFALDHPRRLQDE